MKKKDIDDVGMFNVLLIGENTHSISIADNIKNKFCSDEVENQLKFNIVDDIERDVKSNSWFNEFIFETTSLSRFNNIPMSVGFYKWMCNAKTMEWLYMKKLLQAMNVVIVDVDNSNDDMVVFDKDIPQCKFNSNKDFLGDLIKWIDGQLSKLTPKMNTIRLIKSFGGKNLPFLGDVFGVYLERSTRKSFQLTQCGLMSQFYLTSSASCQRVEQLMNLRDVYSLVQIQRCQCS